MANDSLSERVYQWTDAILLYPYRLSFVFQNPEEFKISTLRGVWGRALKTLDEGVYSKIFEGSGSQQLATPRYLLRPGNLLASPNEPRVEIEFIVWGASGNDLDIITRAWHIATQFGLGKERRTFALESSEYLYLPVPESGLSLSRIVRALETLGKPRSARFVTPVRLLELKRLIEEPTFETFIQRTIARLSVIRLQSLDRFEQTADKGRPAELRPDFYPELLELAKNYKASKWSGEKIAYQRYSGRQRAEVEMRGATGGWKLPEDLGDLRPLVEAATVLGIGKGTALGLGRLKLERER
ncbi:MAG: CRISPR system precrRNA processing endoribonuclease RAMP protein Cas6 [Thermoguttaceae bacterium]|nr:CRISPR system precrRNA processing endoribonuclease RAMP protein Cas6 [Thermoguttaceae bacterium]